MTDRMRWEWLASAASFFGAAPELRVVEECLHAFDPAMDAAAGFRGELPFAQDVVVLIRAMDAFETSLAIAHEPTLER